MPVFLYDGANLARFFCCKSAFHPFSGVKRRVSRILHTVIPIPIPIVPYSYTHRPIPLQAVGWEGTFGFTTLALLLVPFSFIEVGPAFGHGPRNVLEDAYDGVYQLWHNPLLALAFSGTIISIAFFNFAGIRCF